MRQMRCLTIAASLYVLMANPVQAAEQPIASEQLTCGSGDVLHFLAQTIQSTNNLVPTLGFDFNAVTTKRRVVKKGLVDLQCEAVVSLINQEDQKVASSLKVTYNLKSDAKTGGYILSFEPMR